MKTMKYIWPVFALQFFLSACNQSKIEFDATGTFEAEEITVSSEAMGQIKQLTFNEGDQVKEGQFLGYVDSTQVYLKLQQINAQIGSITARRPEIQAQLKVFDDQIAVLKIKKETLLKEKSRFEKLVEQKAAPGKQLDDIIAALEELDAQVVLVKQQKQAAASNLHVQLKGLNQDPQALILQKEQLQDQLSKYRLSAPACGTVS